jgi:vacuolar protein sorting-associated protein 26
MSYLCFRDKDSITGNIAISLNRANQLDHLGIKVELIGEIELFGDKSGASRFIALSRELDSAGQISKELSTYPFIFSNAEKEYETYKGKSIECRYFIRCTLSTKLKNFTSEEEFGVQNIVETAVENINSDGLKLDVLK